MPPSFLGLPAELRVKILEYLLINSANVASNLIATIDADSEGYENTVLYGLWTESNRSRINIHPAILSTCRLCAAEGEKILYYQNRFHIADLYNILEPFNYPSLHRLKLMYQSGEVFQRYPMLRSWAKFRHLSVVLLETSSLLEKDYQSQVEFLTVLCENVFPNLQSLRLATDTVEPTLVNAQRYDLMTVALRAFEPLQFRAAVYRCRDIPDHVLARGTGSVASGENGHDFSNCKDLSMTLFKSPEARIVKDPATFFLDFKALVDLRDRKLLSSKITAISMQHPYQWIANMSDTLKIAKEAAALRIRDELGEVYSEQSQN